MNQTFIKIIFFELQVHILINIIFLMKLGWSFRKHQWLHCFLIMLYGHMQIHIYIYTCIYMQNESQRHNDKG